MSTKTPSHAGHDHGHAHDDHAGHHGPAKGLTAKLPEMLPKYYAARGWNADGTLKPETRTRLGL